MNNKIMIVDDEPNILTSITRQLRGKYELTVVESGKEAINILKKDKEFALVMSDFKMPVMDGAEFLTIVKEISPDTVRMMLTGQADMEAVIKVINEGNIFRFLTKPCPPELLIKNIDEGIKQHNLLKVEKYLLTRTLGGSLQVMTDILVLAKPIAFNRSLRIKKLVKKMIPYLKIENAWQIEIAATLSQIGCITIPDAVLTKIYEDIAVSIEDEILYNLQSRTASEMIAKIPRLEPVAKIILYQGKYYDGSGMPGDEIKGMDIPLGSRILRLAIDYDAISQHENSWDKSIDILKNRKGLYDTKLLTILEKAVSGQDEKRKYVIKEINISDLKTDMYIAELIIASTGETLCTTKQQVTDTLILKLQNHLKSKEIKETIKVILFRD